MLYSAMPCPGETTADHFILSLYRELLDRDPSAGERAEWLSAMLHGLSPEQARAAFLESGEYREHAAQQQRKAAIAATGMFDGAWYLATYHDVAGAGLDPLDHYACFGAEEGRQPNAYFDDAWYRTQTRLAPDHDVLLHYAHRGEASGQPPSPYFEPAWYRAAYGLDAGTSPLAHFLAGRGSRRFAPNPHLWGVSQRLAQQDTVPPEDPFLPLLTPAQDPLRAAAADIGLLRASGLFDANHYQIVNGDVFDAGMEMLAHYCAYGWREGRHPNLYFDPAWYVATNPAVARLQVNPLVHYLLVGEPAGRRPIVYFEPAWYRRTYGVAPDASPLAHYLAHRRSQQVSPNALFDLAYYRAQFGGALHGRRDLFAHYLMAGMRSDVRPSPDFDAAAWRRRTRGRPSKHFRHGLTPERDNPLVTFLLAHYR